jgi:penicillin amidase
MSVLFRWLFRLVSLAVVLSVATVAVVAWIASRSIPDYEADWTVTGISAPVEIVRNTSAVPHIFGETDADVFYALGLAHAQDRLWQMLMLRRTAEGRLSELFGPDTAQIDDLLRRLDLDRYANASVDALEPETRDVLEAYADGVNAWIGIVSEEALGRGAPELLLFEPEIAPWRPADSIAISLIMALQLAVHHEEEVLRARTSLALGDPDRLLDLLPDAPGGGAAELVDFAALFDGPVPRFAQGDTTPRHPLHPNRWGRGRGGASNVFAAAPSRSAAGGAILANDPHLNLTSPSIWYLARLELSSGGVIGATIPGMPAILVGRSERLAWGLTAAYLDDIDLYVEQLNPDNPEEYRTPDGWAEFETRREIIEIDGAAPVTITLRETENGPVIPGSHFDFGAVTPPGHVMSMAWTALTEENTSIQTGLKLMRATTIEEALEAGEDFVAPAQNLMLASADGRIAMQVIGHMPWRTTRHATQARMPSPGWEEDNRWLGITQYFANPRFVDPDGGLLGNTNNKSVDRDFPLHVSFDWGDTQRITRLTRLMQDREVHTRDAIVLGRRGCRPDGGCSSRSGRRARAADRPRRQARQEDPHFGRRALQLHQHRDRAGELPLREPAFREIGAQPLHPVGLSSRWWNATASPGTKRRSGSFSATARPGRSSPCCWRNAAGAVWTSACRPPSARSAMPTAVHRGGRQRTPARDRDGRAVHPENGRDGRGL